MPWTPLVERLTALPLILAGPILRRTEPGAVTVWLALKGPRRVTLRIYARNNGGSLLQAFEGTHRTIRLGDHLHVVAVTARATANDERLAWGERYFYDLFFQPIRSDEPTGSLDSPVPVTADHLATPGILIVYPSHADALHRLVYPGHPLPGFVLPPEEVNQLRIVHGSCRKPHGIGLEMLSALDGMLETSIQQGEVCPQQLFLTGDQIYADDVAAPLLFTLMDAGNVLCEGNRQALLPSTGIPVRDLAPGTRADLIRNKALFTTSTPHNHLLSFSEYAAMHLFAWSDALWPDDLPDAEQLWSAFPQARPAPGDVAGEQARYSDDVHRLEEFRSRLPQVRRALANIATYTICDDHEITDDWYLDGAWCRNVLDSVVGRWIIRNGLLAYAFFQAWGNTPEQFAGEHGSELLAAVDSWRGDESDASSQIIERLLGMPAPFGGSGELDRSAQALTWHYTCCGPRYQVIVMDTRTHRLYRTPDEFPGLLSPHAMYAQVAAPSHQEAEVTILISATPVLGVDLVESIQFLSRLRIKQNYAFDREAWALEWSTFQRLLKTTSAMKRVLFLSGDVHYAFGSSLDYWDEQTQATARFVNYTSSSLHNEGAGSHIAVLAVGYPRLLHLLRREGTATLDFFAWDIPPGNRSILNHILTLIHRRLYLFWWSIPRLLAARRTPYEIILPAHGWLKGAFRAIPPDRVYRIHYLHNTLARIESEKRYTIRDRLSMVGSRLIRFALAAVTLAGTTVGKLRSALLRETRRIEQTPRATPHPAQALAQQSIRGANSLQHTLEHRRNSLVSAILRRSWLNRWKAGELIIGYNNLGEIRFEWDAERKAVSQRLWWRTDDAEQPLRTTEYAGTLEFPAWDDAPPLP